MKNSELELYTDYLLSSFGATTATGLSAMVEGDVSHDRITRFLSRQDYTSKELWIQVKAMVREVQAAHGVLIFDDTIQEKAWTDESDLICWHYDHCSGRTVKGLNLLNALYHCNGRSIPVAFELVQKRLQCDIESRQVKRKSEITKNEMMREMIRVCLQNALQFRFVLMDSWFSSEENFDFITSRGKHFIAALKDNRLVALSQEDWKKKRFVRIDKLEFPEQGAVQGWLKGSARAVRLVRQVFKNQDSSTGILHLVCSDLTCDYDDITMNYKKRWQVEVFHKSLKSNAGMAKSPTQTLRTQSNHVFMAIYAVFKLECLSVKSKINPFALRFKLLINATRSAFVQLQKFQAAA
nr:transposase [uncultured Rhodoferax sp.]